MAKPIACVRYSVNAEDGANAAPFYAAARCSKCLYWNDLKLAGTAFICAQGCGKTRRQFEAVARRG